MFGNLTTSTGVTVHRERRWTSAGATLARELVRSPGSNRSGSGGNEAVGAFGVEGRRRIVLSMSECPSHCKSWNVYQADH
jgi:hypothetical protein